LFTLHRKLIFEMEKFWSFILAIKPEEHHWLAAIIVSLLIFVFFLLIFFDHYWILPDGTIVQKPSFHKIK